MSNNIYLILYALPILGIFAWYIKRHSRQESRSSEVLSSAARDGLLEPATLHPEIDPNICIGCQSCVAACPEQHTHTVLGMIRNKARLIGPSNCIGHGACKTACPVGAITLVFGTARRGVDIPFVNPNFETNVPGIFIAGELGGMGLIKNAIEQGRQAMQSIRTVVKKSHANELDVVIVGAGPAGIAATLAAKESGLRSATLEQDSLGGTVAHFPRRKLVMTQPANLPMIGKVKFREVSKEDLIGFWKDVEAKTGIAINYGEQVQSIKPCANGKGYEVQTTRKNYSARTVLLSIGRRGTPRTLDVPGENLPKVVYRLIDPEQFQNMHVLVVGGGDSAIEAAVSLSEEPGTTVTLSYRSAAFGRAKLKNRERIQSAAEAGRINIVLNSTVETINEKSVVLNIGGDRKELPNNAVIISAGGILPTTFLQSVGIKVETKWGTE